MMRHGTASVVLLAGILLAGCSDESTGPEPGDTFTLSPGERVTLQPNGTHVRFLRVSEDSRCPLRAQCVWAGDGAVVLEVAPRDGDATEHVVHTTEGPTSVVLGRYELTLLALTPYPEEPGDIRPDDYRVELVLYERLE